MAPAIDKQLVRSVGRERASRRQRGDEGASSPPRGSPSRVVHRHVARLDPTEKLPRVWSRRLRRAAFVLILQAMNKEPLPIWLTALAIVALAVVRLSVPLAHDHGDERAPGTRLQTSCALCAAPAGESLATLAGIPPTLRPLHVAAAPPLSPAYPSTGPAPNAHPARGPPHRS